MRGGARVASSGRQAASRQSGASARNLRLEPLGELWIFAPEDDVGGDDDCDATPYDSEEAAREAAEQYAEDHDECEGLSAAEWQEQERDREIEAGKSDDGEWVLAHKDGSRWDNDRYADREAAESAISAWHTKVQAANRGTKLLWHLMDTPQLARLTQGGEVEIMEAEEQ